MNNVSNGRTLADILTEIRDEIKEFAQIRLRLLTAELGQTFKLLKVAALLAGGALVLLGTAYIFITLGLAALVAAFFAESPYRWVFGFLAVGILWAILGVVAGYFAKREFALKGIAPNRTIAVLKGDKLWIQTEAKNQL